MMRYRKLYCSSYKLQSIPISNRSNIRGFNNLSRWNRSVQIERVIWQAQQKQRDLYIRNESLSKALPSSTQPSSSESAAESTNVVRPAGAIAMTPPRAIFPWRHEIEPLPRLIKGSRESLEQGGAFGPGIPFAPVWYMSWIMERVAANQLLVPWYRILAGNQWRHELAESCSWAFSQGVAAVLSNTYKVPFDNIKSEDSGNGEIQFRHDLEKDLANDETIEPPKENGGSAENNVEFCPEVEYMLEAKLRHLYESAHNCGKGNMRIRLQCQPTSATLESLAWLPLLTRDMVAAKPALKHSYSIRSEMARRADKRGRAFSAIEAMQLGMELAERLSEETSIYQTDPVEQHVWYGTVVAQVSVQCLEIFSVMDLKTGEVVQGHADEKARPVTHLVRLENEVQSAFPVDGSLPTYDIGSWQITDWDDLLNGNMWLSL